MLVNNHVASIQAPGTVGRSQSSRARRSREVVEEDRNVSRWEGLIQNVSQWKDWLCVAPVNGAWAESSRTSCSLASATMGRRVL